ncbi:MAG: hypothetical protein RL392_607 [Pseudomonadota bacterium]
MKQASTAHYDSRRRTFHGLSAIVALAGLHAAAAIHYYAVLKDGVLASMLRRRK